MTRVIGSMLFMATLFGFVYGLLFKGPEVRIDATVEKLTEEEYDVVGTFGVKNPTKDDFRIVMIELYIRHDSDMERIIDFPTNREIKQILNDTPNQDRYWFGVDGGYEDNESENEATYKSGFVMYKRGLNKQDLQQLFNKVPIKVAWEGDDGNVDRVYWVGEVLEFEEEG